MGLAADQENIEHIKSKDLASAGDSGDYYSLQQRQFKKFVIASVIGHIVVVVLINFSVFPSSLLVSDLEIETAVVSERDLLPESKETVLPNALKAESEAVHKQVLPQLPKMFEVEKPKVDEPTNDKEGKEVEQSKELQQQIKEQDEAEAEKAPVKGEGAKVEEKQENKVTELELQKRLALEALRKEQKFSDQVQAPKTDALAKLKKDAQLQSSTGKTGVADLATTRYLMEVKKAIERCYSLPDTYNIKRADISAVIYLKIDGSGKVADSRVAETNDETFSQIVLQAASTCPSIPPPPRGESVEAQFLFKLQ